MASPSPSGNMKWVFSVTASEQCTGRKTNRRASCTSTEFLVIPTSVCGNKQKREKILKKRRERSKEPHLDAPGKQCLMLWGKVQGPSMCQCEVCRSYPSSCALREESQLCRRSVSHEQPSSDIGGHLASSCEVSHVCQMKKEFLTRRLMCLIHPPLEYHLSY